MGSYNLTISLDDTQHMKTFMITTCASSTWEKVAWATFVPQKRSRGTQPGEVEISMGKRPPGWLGLYRGCESTHFYGDYFINHREDPY